MRFAFENRLHESPHFSSFDHWKSIQLKGFDMSCPGQGKTFERSIVKGVDMEVHIHTERVQYRRITGFPSGGLVEVTRMTSIYEIVDFV